MEPNAADVHATDEEPTGSDADKCDDDEDREEWVSFG